MEEIKTFDQFYEQVLGSAVKNLRFRSFATRNWRRVLYFSFIFLLGYLLVTYFDRSKEGVSPLPFILLLILAIGGFGIYSHTAERLQHDFKEEIIKKILDFIQPGITYEPHKFISSKYYKASSLRRAKYVEINGDDFFEGTYKNVVFKCSELQTYGKEKSIFSGLFFAAKISPYITGGTYIWSKKHPQHDAVVRSKRVFPMPGVTEVFLGNVEFSNLYDIYSTYPTEAIELLSTYRQQQLINFAKIINAEISFSFVAGHCYAMVPAEKPLFESAKDPGDKEAIKEYFKNILLFLSFIDKLELDKMQVGLK